MDDEIDFGATIRGFAKGQKVFGRYVLKKILGRGGMGVVWLARDEELERDVALKFLPELIATDKQAVKDLKRETRRSLDLTHPHIVRIYDFVQDATSAAISMEYIEGDTLASLKVEHDRGYFEPGEITGWLKQLIGALDYAHHRAEVVHRDLKPANLMIDARNDLKIADFGIAASVSDSVSRVSVQSASSGTPVYMSPQQMMGEMPAVTDDIYALGATLYELLTGRPPFYSGNVMMQVMNKVPPSLTERRAELGRPGADIPLAWAETIAVCLAKESERRPQRVLEVAQRLGLGRVGGVGALVDDFQGLMDDVSRAPFPVEVSAPTDPVEGVPPGELATTPLPATAPEEAPEAVQSPSTTEFRGGSAVGKMVGVFLAVMAVGVAGWWFGYESPQREAEVARIAALRGTIEITTAPGEATILHESGRAAEDGGEFDGLPIGVHRFMITRPGYKSQEISLSLSEFNLSNSTNFVLEPDLGVLTITSEPTGLNYELVSFALEAGHEIPEVRFRGETPARLADLPVGIYTVSVRRDGWESFEDRVTVGGDGVADMVAEFGPGDIAVTSDPAGVDYAIRSTVDNSLKDRGTTPGTASLPPGQYQVLFARKGWPEQRSEIRVRQGTTVNASGDFRYARLIVTSEPNGAEVVSNGKVLGRTEFEMDTLVAGAVAFTVRKAGYESQRLNGVARPGESLKLWANLKKQAGPVSGLVWTVPEAEIKLIPIKSGQFVMGSPGNEKGRRGDEESHSVKITQSFWLGETEVTQAQWKRVRGEASASGFDDLDGNAPVERVTWDEAKDFCRRLTQQEQKAGRLPPGYNYDLPTEAQWEYAGRAGRATAYGQADTFGLGRANVENDEGSSEDDNVVVFRRAGLPIDRTMKVGSFDKNDWGLFDMEGNVWEWCRDHYGSYASGILTDPAGPESGLERVYRGGSWYHGDRYSRFATRSKAPVNERFNFVGFRVALVPTN